MFLVYLFVPGPSQFGANTAVANNYASPWLSSDISKNAKITSLLDKSLPVNTLDIEGQTLVCGSDGETIFTMNLPSLR